MSNQSFNQFAGQAPAGFVPPGAAPVASGWGAPPVGPPAGPPAAPMMAPVGFGAPAAAPTGGSVFGAGAFAGAAPVSDRKDCQEGDYVFEIIKTEQFKSRAGAPMLRILAKVVHAYAGAQPVQSEVTDSIYLGFPGSDSFKYGCADMLELTQHALDCNSDHEVRAKLAAMFPGCPDAWAAWGDAMQDANQPLNQFVAPNPLKGKFYRARVSKVPNKKKPGETHTNFDRMRAVVGG